MIVHFDNVNFASTTGPNSFGRRLANSLLERGHSVVNSSNDAEISLVFIEPTGSPLAKKVVQRLDGIWFAPHEFQKLNVKIKAMYESCNAVIWQSEFDKNMTTKWWGSPRSGTVIHNGVPGNFNTVEHVVQEFRKLRQSYQTVFVCAANWHGQKRLSENIRLFRHLKQFHPSSCLIVLGKGASNLGEKDVYAAGSQSHEVCMQIYKLCDWMLHLAWLDHCPNTVVEALSCGVPVVCTEDGGTKEIVGGYGVVLKETSPYDYQLTQYDSPPPVDFSQILGPLPPREFLGKPGDISMDICVNKYLDLFQRL